VPKSFEGVGSSIKLFELPVLISFGATAYHRHVLGMVGFVAWRNQLKKIQGIFRRLKPAPTARGLWFGSH